MICLVCGGRDYTNRDAVFFSLSFLNSFWPIERVVHGDARGADSLAAAWAGKNTVDVWAFPARWTIHGDRAGRIRNIEMHDTARPDLVVAFPGETGTEHMVAHALKKGTPVIQFEADGTMNMTHGALIK